MPDIVRRALALAVPLVLFAFSAPPASATFHLIEITRVLAGYNGDETIQAIEMVMLFNGQNMVNGTTIKAYDAAGNPLATLGTFSANLATANAVEGRRVLVATMKFRQQFGITPDLQINAGIPVTTGQVSFEAVGCLVNAVAYGAVTTVLNGTTAAPPLPKQGAAVLVRIGENGTFPSCPLGEDAGSKFALRTAGPTNPVTFTNYSGVTVSISSSVSGVDLTPAPISLAVAPNPVRTTALVTAPGYRRLTIHDVQGRLVRTLAWGLERTMSPFRETWDGRDAKGRLVASGVYFLRYDDSAGPRTRRFVVAR